MGPAIFHPHDSHVLAAMIRRLHQPALAKSVICWGTGRPRRDFVHVDDFAKACHFPLECYDDDQPINAETGQDLSIAEPADLVASAVGYCGEVMWDVSKPDATPCKLLDTRRRDALGWQAKTSLAEGIQASYGWFLAHHGDYRC